MFLVLQNDVYFRSVPSAKFECYLSLCLRYVNTKENKLFKLMLITL